MQKRVAINNQAKFTALFTLISFVILQQTELAVLMLTFLKIAPFYDRFVKTDDGISGKTAKDFRFAFCMRNRQRIEIFRIIMYNRK